MNGKKPPKINVNNDEAPLKNNGMKPPNKNKRVMKPHSNEWEEASQDKVK
jgi:hypothetical protein